MIAKIYKNYHSLLIQNQNDYNKIKLEIECVNKFNKKIVNICK